MNPVRLSITANTLPADFCFTSAQALLDQISKSLTVTFTQNFALFNFGPTKPAAGNQDKPWLRTNQDGSIDRWYVFSNGSWKSRHQVPPGVVTIYVDPATGLPANDPGIPFFETYDGGSPGAITATTGPFWVPTTYTQGRPLLPGVDVSGAFVFFPVGKTGPVLSDNALTGHQNFTINPDPNNFNGFPTYTVSRYINRTTRIYYEII